MKKAVKKLAAMTMALLIGAAVPFTANAAEVSIKADGGQTSASKGTLSVNGMATVTAAPDMAIIYVGVNITEKESADAQKKNAEVMADVLKALNELGIEDEDIQTNSYNMYEQYDYTAVYSANASEPRITGYTVTHMLKVKVRELDKVGEILDKVTEAGANQNNGVSFTLSGDNDQVHYIKALELAIEAATKKADAIAKAMGFEIGSPVSVNETSYNYYNPVYYDRSMAQYSMAEAGGGTNISSSLVEITANVNISYDYER